MLTSSKWKDRDAQPTWSQTPERHLLGVKVNSNWPVLQGRHDNSLWNPGWHRYDLELPSHGISLLLSELAIGFELPSCVFQAYYSQFSAFLCPPQRILPKKINSPFARRTQSPLLQIFSPLNALSPFSTLTLVKPSSARCFPMRKVVWRCSHRLTKLWSQCRGNREVVILWRLRFTHVELV